MAEFASLPLFTDAWIADTSHLSRAERGLYMDLLILCWRSPECRVPNEIDWIARKLNCENGEVEALKKIIGEFMSSTGNWLFQKRLRKEFRYTRDKRKKQSERAKRRYNKDNSASRGSAAPQPSGTAAAGSAPSPSPSPSPTPTLKNPLSEGGGAKAPSHTNGTRLSEDWEALDAHWEAAIADGLTEIELRYEHAQFKDYWIGKAGKDATKLDWDRTWQKWMRKAANDKRQRRNPYSVQEAAKH